MNFDHTSFQIPKPLMDYESAKRYWDGKHHMYSFKTGVGISPNTGYAVYISPYVQGSTSDYHDFCSRYLDVMDYMKRTEQEKTYFVNDEPPFWGISMDKGYTGPDTDTPGIRRLVVKRDPKTDQDREYNKFLYESHLIERIFGRLKRKWSVSRSIYRNSYKYFEKDIENCIFLTNEDIRFRKLIAQDYEFYRAYQYELLKGSNEKKAKRKLQYEEYKTSKKLKEIQLMTRS